ncbi:MAG: hypothetical protein R3B90_05125 [Planctomycetaceae bacterium]
MFRLPSISAACVALFAAAAAVACSVPVFRYAIERWQPDPYEVLVYFDADLTEAQLALLERLNPEYVPGEPFPNSAVQRVDLRGEVRPEYAAIWSEERSDGPLPWVVVRTPWKGQNTTVWAGPLADAAVDTILTSPIRSRVTRQLLDGVSVVWLYLPGEDAEASAETRQLIAEQLERLESAIVLPEIRPEDLAGMRLDPEGLSLRFTIIDVARGDAREQLLLKSLLSLQPDLQEPPLSGEPLLFPVFGRGRAFFPLVGPDINAQNLEDLARFLTGACQCTIKQQNPGVDLLTPLDWESALQGVLPDEVPVEQSGLGGFVVTEDTSAAARDEAARVAGRTDDSPALAAAGAADVSSPPSMALIEPAATFANAEQESTRTPGENSKVATRVDGPGNVVWLLAFVAGAVVLAGFVLLGRAA